MAEDGKETSEHKMAKVANWVTLAVAALSAIMTALNPDSIAYVIIAAVVAAANSFVSGSYAKSRGIVKSSQALNVGKPSDG